MTVHATAPRYRLRDRWADFKISRPRRQLHVLRKALAVPDRPNLSLPEPVEDARWIPTDQGVDLFVAGRGPGLYLQFTLAAARRLGYRD